MEINSQLSCCNLLCRLNKCGTCDAEDMVDLLCSSLDLYNLCQERKKGSEFIEALEKISGKKLIKSRKGKIEYVK